VLKGLESRFEIGAVRFQDPNFLNLDVEFLEGRGRRYTCHSCTFIERSKVPVILELNEGILKIRFADIVVPFPIPEAVVGESPRNWLDPGIVPFLSTSTCLFTPYLMDDILTL
jgi:hypothetical protein